MRGFLGFLRGFASRKTSTGAVFGVFGFSESKGECARVKDKDCTLSHTENQKTREPHQC
jgi:hypothetical protein